MLSTATASAEDLYTILPWLGGALVLVLIGGFVIYFARRSARDDGESGAGGFTLHDLRRMHREGQLSDAEFALAKSQMIDALRPKAEDEDEDEDEDTNGPPDGSEPASATQP